MTTALYRFYDSEDQLLYVGITHSLDRRTASHRARSAFWDLVAVMAVERFPDRLEAEAAERIAIRDEDPIFNSARYAPIGGRDWSPWVSACNVCNGPVVERLEAGDDPENLVAAHDACITATVNAYRRGKGVR